MCVNSLVKYLLCVCCLFISLGVMGQDIASLRSQQLKLMKELHTTKKLLKQAQKNVDISLSQLKLIKNSIRQRRKLITKYQLQLDIYNECINDYNFVITSLDQDVSKAKKSYEIFLNNMNLEGASDKNFVSVLTSKNFKEYYQKEGVLAQYQKIQTSKITLINSLSVTIKQSQILMYKKREEMLKLANKVKRECDILDNEYTIENSFYQNLKDKERELKTIVVQQNGIADRLKREILEEGGDSSFSSKSNMLYQKGFEKRKGVLKWPVKGVVIDHFGVHRHSVMKGLKVNNKWITISTLPNEKVQVVYDGVVTAVIAIKHGNLSVFVRHGSYITVYSNLKSVYVKKDQKIKAGATIGNVYSDNSGGGNALLKFQIWKLTNCLDPEDWLTRVI